MFYLTNKLQVISFFSCFMKLDFLEEKKLKSILKEQRFNVLRSTECNKLNATSIETIFQATCINKIILINHYYQFKVVK